MNEKDTKVGKAVYDILCKNPSHTQEVGETIEGMSPRYRKELIDTIEKNIGKYKSPFYVVVLRKKEVWAMNVLRQWYVARQTRPSAKVLRRDYPNHDHDVWKVDGKTHQIDLEWSLPTAQDAKAILKTPDSYDRDVVKWLRLFREGRLA
jgi:hypothetical protein